MNDTKKLVEFVHDTSYSNIPAPAISLCKKHLIDCLAATLSAVKQPSGDIVYSYLKDSSSTGKARLIGYGLELSVNDAAFGNGILSHIISFDDSGPSHPSVTVIPALLALGESLKIDGKTILTAQVLGYEVFQKLNKVTQKARQIRDAGWHPTGFFGAVTSALISAKLLGLNIEQSINAVGIAASMGAGLSRNIGNMTMSLHAGNASRNGITASFLARKGFTGNHEILEGKFGLMSALAGVGNYSIDLLTENFGNPFSIIEPGINIKCYPCCWGHHKLLDAMFYLVKKHNIKPEDVDSIVCDLQPEKSTSRYLTPKNEFEAKYSIGFGLASILLDRQLTFEQYSPDRIFRPEIRETMSKISHIPRGPLDAPNKFEVMIVLQDGATYSKTVSYAKGHASQNPQTENEIVQKFNDCAKNVLPAAKIERSIEIIQKLETLGQIKSLVDNLTV